MQNRALEFLGSRTYGFRHDTREIRLNSASVSGPEPKDSRSIANGAVPIATDWGRRDRGPAPRRAAVGAAGDDAAPCRDAAVVGFPTTGARADRPVAPRRRATESQTPPRLDLGSLDDALKYSVSSERLITCQATTPRLAGCTRLIPAIPGPMPDSRVKLTPLFPP